MMFQNRISLFVATFLIIGFFFLAMPEKGYSGFYVPGGPPCCDIPSDNLCAGGEEAFIHCPTECVESGDCIIVENGICVPDDESGHGSCISPADIPTLSEWGLIAMAGVLGIIGLLAIRRRKVIA